MKANLLTAVLLLSSISSVSFAQFENSNTSTYKPRVAAQGVKVSLLLPVLTAKSKFSSTFEDSNGITVKDSDTSSSDDFSTLGFALGYSNLPVQSVGFVGQFAFLRINPDDSTNNIEMLRLEVNAAFAMNEMLYLKGGINLPRIVTKEIKDIDGEIGFQAGLGFQFTQNIGLDLSYSVMSFESAGSGEISSYKSETEFSGLEIGLTGTF